MLSHLQYMNNNFLKVDKGCEVTLYKHLHLGEIDYFQFFYFKQVLLLEVWRNVLPPQTGTHFSKEKTEMWIPQSSKLGEREVPTMGEQGQEWQSDEGSVLSTRSVQDSVSKVYWDTVLDLLKSLNCFGWCHYTIKFLGFFLLYYVLSLLTKP